MLLLLLLLLAQCLAAGKARLRPSHPGTRTFRRRRRLLLLATPQQHLLQQQLLLLPRACPRPHADAAT